MLRGVFIGLLVVHGLIHLMGFAKGFGFAELPQLREPISRGLAGVWLLAAVAMLVTAAFVAFAPAHWWIPAVVALVLSQVAITTSWSDAKLGTIANVILLLPLAITLADLRPSSLTSRYEHDAREALATATSISSAPVTEADLAPLPPLVQTYLRRAGVVGKPRTRTLEMEFRGTLRSKPDADWMPVVGRQVSVFGEGSKRLFFVDGTMMGLPFDGYHRFVGRDATMEVRAVSLFTMVDARGDLMNQSETVTFLNDMCVLAPSTLLDPSVTFTTTVERTVHATYTRSGIAVSADLLFDEAGDLVSFASDDRYMSADGKTYTKYRWVTPLHDYREFHGRRIAAKGEALWKRPEGDLEYGRLEMIDVRQGPGEARERPAAVSLAPAR